MIIMINNLYRMGEEQLIVGDKATICCAVYTECQLVFDFCELFFPFTQ